MTDVSTQTEQTLRLIGGALVALLDQSAISILKQVDTDGTIQKQHITDHPSSESHHLLFVLYFPLPKLFVASTLVVAETKGLHVQI
jgi:hypothetical protein